MLLAESPFAELSSSTDAFLLLRFAAAICQAGMEADLPSCERGLGLAGAGLAVGAVSVPLVGAGAVTSVAGAAGAARCESRVEEETYQ